MYYSHGIESALKTLITLSKPYSLNGEIGDRSELKTAYHRFLAQYQPEIPIPNGDVTAFVETPELIEQLIKSFQVKSLLNDKKQGDVINGRFGDVLARLVLLKSGLAGLQKIAPDFVDYFNLIINYVFCASSTLAGGGSSSAALGVIWAANRETWDESDIFEFFVHEATHNMVFLDECRYKHYPNYPALSSKENFARSAILSVPRPLDKVIHSLIVSAEVLSFREKTNRHPLNPKLHPHSGAMISQAILCIESLRSLPNLRDLTTSRSRELLEGAADIIFEIKGKHQVKYEENKNYKSVPLAI